MTIEEAHKKADELKGYVENNLPFNSVGKAEIENLYYKVLGRTLVPTSCQQCYHDAIVEIVWHLNKYGNMAEEKNFVLKAGVIINCPNFHNGEIFANDNLTDEIAEEYLRTFPDQMEMFEVLPENFDPTAEEKKKKKK